MGTARCLLDMDGVIADFAGAAFRHCNETLDIIMPPGEMADYDIARNLGLKEEALYRTLGTRFWEFLPKTKDADDIVDALVQYYGERNICICTSIATHSPGCYEGKMRWIKRHYPWLKDRVMTVTPKSFAASPSTLLVDDCGDNIDRFISAGGKGLLIPRRWNRNYKFEGVAGFVGLALGLVNGIN